VSPTGSPLRFRPPPLPPERLEISDDKKDPALSILPKPPFSPDGRRVLKTGLPPLPRPKTCLRIITLLPRVRRIRPHHLRLLSGSFFHLPVYPLSVPLFSTLPLSFNDPFPSLFPLNLRLSGSSGDMSFFLPQTWEKAGKPSSL